MATVYAYFDTPTGVYQPGEMVTGRVHLVLSHTVTLRGIELLFHGHSEVKWIENETERDDNGKQRVVQKPFESNELYFYSKFFVFGDAYAGNVLHAGEYDFAFTMQLPSQLPSSFEGELGYVRHEMTVMSFPKIGNTPTTFPFRVINHLNLNTFPNLKSPVRVMDEKTLCCWCCASSPVSCSLYLPSGGFSIGQQMPITVDVDNLSSTTVEGVTIVLKRVDTFIAVRPERETKKKTQKLITLQLEPVRGRTSNTWERSITIPDGPPSGLPHCSIISSQYFVCVNVELPIPHVDMTIQTAIIVGNVPLATAPEVTGPYIFPQAVTTNSTLILTSPPPYPYPNAPTAPVVP